MAKLLCVTFTGHAAEEAYKHTGGRLNDLATSMVNGTYAVTILQRGEDISFLVTKDKYSMPLLVPPRFLQSRSHFNMRGRSVVQQKLCYLPKSRETCTSEPLNHVDS